MVWNEEENQKSHLFGDFLDPNIDIDCEGRIRQHSENTPRGG